MSKKRILYIEDNPLNMRLVRKLLTVKGYDVLEAVDGLVGVEMAKQERPDLILMDINIPGIDGMEATARLKQSEVAYIPIVALTANAMVGDRERIMAAGCDEYMQKPVSNALLWDMVERFVGKGEAPPKPTSARSTGTHAIPARHAAPMPAANAATVSPALSSQPTTDSVGAALSAPPAPLAVTQLNQTAASGI